MILRQYGSARIARLSAPAKVLCIATAVRLSLLVYGLLQDTYSPVKYTDIDYQVFTDAARYVATGSSPYERETYRYTPLLAWILIPTSWGGWWILWGKALFAASDLIAGVMIAKALHVQGLEPERAWKYASIWLLNPMVATISTRGSSEGLLGAIIATLIYCVVKEWTATTAMVLGVAVHFKIYPFIYGVPILWSLSMPGRVQDNEQSVFRSVFEFPNRSRMLFLCVSLTTFAVLNGLFFVIYGTAFLQHTYFHHLSRVDHRHNFSPYNTILHLSSFATSTSPGSKTPLAASLAFAPQLLLSTVMIPLALTKGAKMVPAIMFAQTLAFTTLNKVVTSQYFLWYLVVLPFHLPSSSLLERPNKSFVVLGLWVGSQVWYLYQAYNVEFLGKSRFAGISGLWGASLGFLAVNLWILGIVVRDIASMESDRRNDLRREDTAAKKEVAEGIRHSDASIRS